MEITVATDGSALNNPHGPAGWAWFVDENRYALGAVPKGSNQMMEMYAIIQALRSIPLHYDVKVLTDSQFCINLAGKDGKSGWMQTWKARSWIKPDKKVPANLKLVKALDQVLGARKGRVTFEWVKGHNGNPMNSMADKLCTSASAAQLAGKRCPTGPGWITINTTPPVPRTAPRSVGTRATLPTSRRRPAGTSSAQGTKIRTRTTVDRSIITSFDDGPDMPDIKSTKPKHEYCPACGGIIHPDTKECRCSN
jgi:ribonuclease HI